MGLNLFSNNASGRLASAMSAVDTSLTLGAGEGDLFPNPIGAEYFYITVFTAGNLMEIMKVTARATNTLSVERAQDGTPARAFAASDYVELRLIGASLGNFAQVNSENTFAQDQTFSGDTSTAGTATINAATVITTLEVGGVATFIAPPVDSTGRKFDKFPSGTKMLFAQAAAPTGWTAINTLNDYALRLVSATSGTGGTTASNGDTAFSAVFDARTILQANLPAVSLAVTGTTDTEPDHTHTFTGPDNGSTHPTGSGRNDPTGVTTRTTDPAGAHSHSVTGSTENMGSGTAMNFNVQALDVIQASKD